MKKIEPLGTTSNHPPPHALVFQAVCNLVSCPDSQLAAVEAGAVPCLRQLAKLGVPEIEVSSNYIASRETITKTP